MRDPELICSNSGLLLVQLRQSAHKATQVRPLPSPSAMQAHIAQIKGYSAEGNKCHKNEAAHSAGVHCKAPCCSAGHTAKINATIKYGTELLTASLRVADWGEADLLEMGPRTMQVWVAELQTALLNGHNAWWYPRFQDGRELLMAISRGARWGQSYQC